MTQGQAKQGRKDQGLRQSMAWLHTWVGLLPGWVLYVIFVFGTAAFFQHEIDGWMRPELSSETRVSPRALAAADAVLKARAGGAESAFVSMPDPRGGSGLELSWRMKDEKRGGDGNRVILDPATGEEAQVRATKGGYFLYRFHFDLHYMPVMWARMLVSIAALAMLVAILSGVVTHKKIFTDFFMLRFGKGQRSWLDAHNASAVLVLPFYLMITYTGLATLLFTLMPWALAANFPDRQAFYKTTFAAAPEREASGRPAATIPLTGMIATAQQHWDGALPTYIGIDHPGDGNTTITLYPEQGGWGHPSHNTLYLDGPTGALLPSTQPVKGGAQATWRAMIDLHTAWFAGYGLRWLLALSGLGGVAMVATGLCLWCVKRRARLHDPARPHFGFRLVEGLNIGCILGAPLGIAAYFLANRLLPFDLADRAAWEINSLFIVWGGVLVWGFARAFACTAARAWVEMLALSAALFAAVPLLNALTTTRGLGQSLPAGDWIFAGFDLSMLALAGGFALAARKLALRKARPAPRQRARREATA
ncbi:PepSY-associated TM helix domain-containing protein [Novosphingobium terrae]|uniref:PepSY-associated TM helix domain-containing protein n=1 Tax=Novosphingobium terrae TaxID=2726189 RepID=UPI0019811BE9|nr:PepSY-associated TM helix domain-containing protein [Novosphingobium terrae]